MPPLAVFSFYKYTFTTLLYYTPIAVFFSFIIRKYYLPKPKVKKKESEYYCLSQYFQKKEKVCACSIIHDQFPLLTCFFALPNSTVRTLLAKLSEQNDSLELYSVGLTVTIMSVLESFDSES